MTDGRRITTKKLGYSTEVHEKAFYLWYKFRPEMKQLVIMLREDLGEEARVPSFGVLRTWKMVEDWEGHADALDGQAEQAGDIEIIHQRQQIIQRMASVGQELVDMGMKYLKDNGIENSADAIRAIGKGAELQDKLLGWAAYYAELANATNADLDNKLKKFMTQENIIETTATDDTTEPTDDT